MAAAVHCFNYLLLRLAAAFNSTADYFEKHVKLLEHLPDYPVNKNELMQGSRKHSLSSI